MEGIRKLVGFKNKRRNYELLNIKVENTFSQYTYFKMNLNTL